MNSYKNSWERKRRVSKIYQPTTSSYDAEIKRMKFFNSPAYKAARYKAIRDKAYAYIIIGCAITVIGILLMWP